MTDDNCNRALFSGAESLYGWLTHAWFHGQTAVWIVDQYDGIHRLRRPSVAVVDRSEYDEVVAQVQAYHRAHVPPSNDRHLAQ